MDKCGFINLNKKLLINLWFIGNKIVKHKFIKSNETLRYETYILFIHVLAIRFFHLQIQRMVIEMFIQ